MFKKKKKTRMKDFKEKLQELLERNRRNEIEPIEWSQENEELIEGKTIVTTKFKYKAPTPIKRKEETKNKKPQTTHGSEQFEGEELIEIASSLLSDYNDQTVENLPEYSSRLIRYVNNL